MTPEQRAVSVYFQQNHRLVSLSKDFYQQTSQSNTRMNCHADVNEPVPMISCSRLIGEVAPVHASDAQ